MEELHERSCASLASAPLFEERVKANLARKDSICRHEHADGVDEQEADDDEIEEGLHCCTVLTLLDEARG